MEDTVFYTDLEADEVEIEAAVWTVNLRDGFIALGRLGNEALGFDCAGVVTRVGSAVSASGQVKPGDRVAMFIPGCMRSHPRASIQATSRIPDSLSFEAAAAIPGPGITAYYALIEIARLQRGEKVLIHSAAGSTGQMAVAIAQMLGAEIFATVGSDSKRELLMCEFAIPEDHILYSRDTSFAQGIKRATKSRGVDVGLP